MNVPMDDKQLREYLLGGLTPEEREQIECRIFEDDDFADSLRDREADLLDAFTSGTLNQEDRRRFGALAGNPAWAAKLAVSQWIASQSARTPFGRPARTTPLWLGWAAALAAATVAGWLARENSRLSALPDKPAASLVASVSLTAGAQRDSSDRRFVISPSSEVLRVEMPAESGYDDYVLSVEGSGGSFTVPALLRADTVVGWIPSAMLPSGHYDFLLKARRGGASELLATYPVKIERN
jgi:hypothetical protein